MHILLLDLFRSHCFFSYLPSSCLSGLNPSLWFPPICLRFLPGFCHISRPVLYCPQPLPLPHPHLTVLYLFNACFAHALPLHRLLFYFFVHTPTFLIHSKPPSPCHPSLSMAPFPLSDQCPWGSSPHPCSRCSMPLAGQAWAPWASPSSCWRTTLRWRSQRWTSITMRWTLSPTSAHGESTGNKTRQDTFIWFSFLLFSCPPVYHINPKDQCTHVSETVINWRQGMPCKKSTRSWNVCSVEQFGIG